MIEKIQKLPNVAGVYFFYDNNDNLIYIGKSINIKKEFSNIFKEKIGNQ